MTPNTFFLFARIRPFILSIMSDIFPSLFLICQFPGKLCSPKDLRICFSRFHYFNWALFFRRIGLKTLISLSFI